MFDLGRSFLATVERSPRAVAIVDGEQRLTYAEWYAEICRVTCMPSGPPPLFGRKLKTGMPSILALSARLSCMPVPGKTMTPICSTSSMASLRLNATCGTLRLADGQPVVVRAK
jgi:hypothetical protein